MPKYLSIHLNDVRGDCNGVHPETNEDLGEVTLQLGAGVHNVAETAPGQIAFVEHDPYIAIKSMVHGLWK